MLKKSSLLFIIFAVMFSLMYFYLMPIHWDDYAFDREKITNIFSLGYAHSPGRQASVWLNTISTQIFGVVLGNVLNSPLLGIKIIHSIFSTTTLFLIWIINAYFIANTRRQFYILLFVLPPLFSLLNIAYAEYAFVIQIFGGYVFALISMIPVVSYYKQAGIKWFDHRYYGLWIAFIYLGTQITEGSSLPWAGFSVATAIYIYIYIYIYSKKEHYRKDEQGKKLIPFLLLYIGMFLFSLLRTIFIDSPQRGRSTTLNFSLTNLYNRLFHLSLFHDITIVLGICIAIYYCVKFLFFIRKNDISKLEQSQQNRSDCLIAFLTIISLTSIVLLIVKRAFYFDQPLMVLWCAELMFIIKILEKIPKFKLLVPISILGLWILSAGYFVEVDRYRKNRTSLFMMQSKKDWLYVEKFVTAEKENIPFVYVTEEEIKKYDLGLSFNEENINRYPPISEWMLKHGYTTKLIHIVKTNSTNIGENI